MLNVKPMYLISEEMQKFGQENGILVSSSIVTNGSLIERELLEDLIKLGLKSMKVTIDGVREIHDSRRPFAGGKGSFDVVFGNISKIPDNINLTIQANLDAENLACFPQLLDFLEESNLKDRIDCLTASAVAQPIGLSVLPDLSGCAKPSDSSVAEELTYMRRLLVERGFKSKHSKIRHAICSMLRNGSVIIVDPFGVIYTCPMFVGREGFSIGNIYTPNGDQIPDKLELQLDDCFQCAYFPMCGGGCKHTAYILYGDHSKIACDREYMEYQTRDAIKLIYDQKMRQAAS